MTPQSLCSKTTVAIAKVLEPDYLSSRSFSLQNLTSHYVGTGPSPSLGTSHRGAKQAAHLSIILPLQSGAAGVPGTAGGHCWQLGSRRQAGASRALWGCWASEPEFLWSL